MVTSYITFHNWSNVLYGFQNYTHIKHYTNHILFFLALTYLHVINTFLFLTKLDNIIWGWKQYNIRYCVHIGLSLLALTCKNNFHSDQTTEGQKSKNTNRCFSHSCQDSDSSQHLALVHNGDRYSTTSLKSSL